jgi:peroxin-19
LKELAGKYPDWLAENRATLKESEFDNYNKQFEVTKQICHVFETATLDTDGKMTKQNFDQIFELMQKMQSHGHPPKQLVGEMPSSPFSGDLAKDQCSIS